MAAEMSIRQAASPSQADGVRMVEHAALVPDKKRELDARGKAKHLKAVEGENLPLAQQGAGTEEFIPLNDLRAVLVGTDGPFFADDAHGPVPHVADAHIVGHGDAPVVARHLLQFLILGIQIARRKTHVQARQEGKHHKEQGEL